MKTKQNKQKKGSGVVFHYHKALGRGRCTCPFPELVDEKIENEVSSFQIKIDQIRDLAREGRTLVLAH